MKMLKSSNHGSTLIEIIMAILIFGIITVPLLRAFLVSANSSKKSVEVSEATVAAQSLIERISAADIDELLKDSELKIEIIPGVTMCEDCGKTYSTVQYAKICPHCGSSATYLLEGNGFSIKEIEGA